LEEFLDGGGCVVVKGIQLLGGGDLREGTAADAVIVVCVEGRALVFFVSFCFMLRRVASLLMLLPIVALRPFLNTP